MFPELSKKTRDAVSSSCVSVNFGAAKIIKHDRYLSHDLAMQKSHQKFTRTREETAEPIACAACALVHDILFQIPLSRKDIYSRFWLVKTTVWPNTRRKQANQKRLYISMRLSGIWNKISCTNTQTVKTTVWHKQTGCSAGYWVNGHARLFAQLFPLVCAGL